MRKTERKNDDEKMTWVILDVYVPADNLTAMHHKIVLTHHQLPPTRRINKTSSLLLLLLF
jgi:hypothetical protein